MSISSSVIPYLPTSGQKLANRIKASPLGYRLVKGSFWSLAGALISRGLGLLASICVARTLGKVGFGELGVIQGTVVMFGTFAGFGMGMTATKHVAEYRTKDPIRAGRIIRLSSLISWFTGVFMAVVLALVAPWLATNTLAAPHLEGGLCLGALFLFFSSINGAQTGALSGFEAFKCIAQVNSISGLASFPLVVGGVWLFGLKGAVGGLVISQAINSLLSHFALRSEIERSGITISTYADCLQELSVVWKYSVPAVVSSLMVGPTYWFCSTLLVNKPGGYAEMGVFNATNQWFGALMFLPGILGQAVFPMFAEQMGINKDEHSGRLLFLSIKINAAIMIPFLVFGSLASKLIMHAYGTGYEDAWLTLIVVLLTGALLAVQTPVGQFIAAANRMWLGTLMNIGWAVCFVALTWAMVRWGALGFVTARMFAYLLHATWTFAFAWCIITQKGNARLQETIT